MFLIPTIIAILLFSFSITGFIFIDFEKGTEKSIRKRKKLYSYLLLFSFVLTGLSIYLFNTGLEERKREKAEQEKNTTYYAVSKETVKQIDVYCKEKHVKYSTQQTCKRRIQYNLKVGKESDGFTPSDVVVKPSGVAPN